MNSRRNFLRTASGAVGGFVFGSAAEADAKQAPKRRTATILHGTGAPNRRAGIVGDFYIDTRAHAIYGPKSTHGWGHPTSLRGPGGPEGPEGPAGPAGASPGAGVSVTGQNVGDYPQWNGSAWVPGNPGVNNDGLVGATLADLTVITSANSTYYQNPGVLIMNACRLNAAASRIAFEVDSAGSGLTAGRNFIGVYDGNGRLVSSTGDLSSIWSSGPSANVVVVNLSQAVEPGFYHVGVLMNYTGTKPYLTGAYCPMIPEIGTSFSAVPRVCFSSSTYTTLPSSVQWAADGFTANRWNFVTFVGFLP